MASGLETTERKVETRAIGLVTNADVLSLIPMTRVASDLFQSVQDLCLPDIIWEFVLSIKVRKFLLYVLLKPASYGEGLYSFARVRMYV